MSPPAGTTGGVCELPPGARIDVLLIRGRAQSLHRLRERELVCAVRRDKVPFTQELSIPRPHGEPLEFDCLPTHSSLHMPIASIGQLHDRKVKRQAVTGQQTRVSPARGSIERRSKGAATTNRLGSRTRPRDPGQVRAPPRSRGCAPFLSTIPASWRKNLREDESVGPFHPLTN